MSWHTSYAGGKIAVTIDRKTHWMEAASALDLAESLRRKAAYAIRDQARRASEAAQARVKQENARHQ